MDNWEKRPLEWEETGDLNYFLREMNRSNACKKMYHAHIFIYNVDNEEQLILQWKDINSRVAVYIQSEVESLIERSNFYICFFVKQEISSKIQNEIEDDTFCAKKYIFCDKKMTLEDKCFEIEKKIFSIKVDSNKKNITKLKEIQLQNFRAYKSRNQIMLCDTDGKSASFVAIYAKNGVGKTSIFDGVEFALTGEVGRFKEIKDKEEGAIYRNRENSNKRAYVELILENNKNIIRNVANVRSGSNDIVRNRLSKAVEILVGKSEDSQKWEQIILPHDKIDNFISAKSGVDRYEEWMKSTNLKDEYKANFENWYNRMSTVKKEINEIDKKIESYKRRLEELEKQRVQVELWIDLINQYNQNNEENKIEFQNGILDEKDYDNIINISSQYIRQNKELFKNVDEKIRTAGKVLTKTVEYYNNCIKRIPQHRKEILQIESKIEKRKRYDDLQEKINQNIKELKKNEESLLPINKIIDYGLYEVVNEKDKFILRKKEIEKYRNLIELRKDEKKELDEKIELIKNQIILKEFNVNDEQQKKELFKKIEKWENYPVKRKKLQDELIKSLTNEQEKNRFIENNTLFLEQLKTFYIPKTINELNIEKIIGVEEYFDSNIFNELKSLKKSYENALKEIRIYQEKNKVIEKNQKELEKLVVQGREYLNKHQDVCKCPLCHADFPNWENLFQSVNSVQENGQELVQFEMKKLSNRIKEIQKEYDELFVKYIKHIENLEERIKFDLQKQEKEKQEIIKQKNDVLINEKEAIKAEEEMKRYLIQENIELSGTANEIMEKWINAQYNKLEILQKNKDKYEKKKDELEKEEARLNKIKQRQEEVIKNIPLYNNILFLKEKPAEYDLKKDFDNLMQLKKELNEQKKQNIAFVKNLDIQNEETILFLNNKREEEVKLLNSDIDVKKEIDIFNPFTEENVQECLNKWKNKNQNINNNIEFLNKVLEENGVREYFREYKKLKGDIDIQSELRISKEKNEKQAEKLFNESKEILKEKLVEYFSQTIISEIFQKINPHQTMKNIKYELDFNDEDNPELYIRVSELDEIKNKDSYRPEWFFSSAQLNMVAFSSFFSRALQAKDLSLNTIFIDDPIGHFDDLNILGFADLLRSVLEAYDCQIIIATHDEKVFNVLERKLSNEYYNSKFIRLPEDCVILKERK
ncbi:AAA domain protein [Clostridium sporogenes]|uniref:AAA family ATPase n=1 Tax=Clostridium TaxID=1485 RepID=UPI000909EDA9|nr:MULTISPECIES: AAA family ATPase [Clostridium]APF25815.1 AAA domain protein [Clostridium sporogenes]MDI6918018.1 AAA family ATPase [Clostridium botulinum]WMU96262.1 AAA family ATPase [Clostridium botulinum]